MAYFKISVSFLSYSDSLFQDKAELIITSITGNADFPNAAPYLNVVKGTFGVFVLARKAAASKGTEAIANKNIARAPLELALKNMGYHLMAEASGDEGKLKKTGYTMSKINTAAVVHAPQNVVVSAGPTPGSINVIVDSVPGAELYNFQYCTALPTADTVWVSEPGTKRKTTLLNLQSGALYYIKVGAKDSNKVTFFSTIVSQYCL